MSVVLIIAESQLAIRFQDFLMLCGGTLSLFQSLRETTAWIQQLGPQAKNIKQNTAL